MIEVIDVRRAGDLGDEPGEAMRPANETVPVRRARFIYSVYRKITPTLKQHTVISYMFVHLLALFVCRLKAARHEDILVIMVNFFFFLEKHLILLLVVSKICSDNRIFFLRHTSRFCFVHVRQEF